MPKLENHVTIEAMPWRAGLTNQGGQATIPENALWDARNADMDSTGRMFKRKGFRKWGLTLQSAVVGGIQYTELFRDLDNWSFSETGNDVLSELSGVNLVFTTKSTTAGSDDTYRRLSQANDGNSDSATQCTVNIFLRANTVLPAQAATTADHGPAIHVRSTHANIFTLLILNDGLYYFNGTNFVLASASVGDIDDGRWHKLQIRLTSATAATVIVDDVGTISIPTFSSYTDVSLSANQVGLSASTNTNGVYSMAYNLVQYRSGPSTNLENASLKVLKDWHSSNPDSSHLLAVTRDVIYEDLDQTGTFTSVDRAPNGDIILVPWLSELLICGSADTVRRWSGRGRLEGVPSQMPQHIIAASAHQGRVFCATSEAPLTVRYSAANDLSTWVNRDSDGNEFTSAFDIPDAKGRRITAMRGDFYGLLIIWTENSTWVFRTVGDPLNDGVLQMVSVNIGCIGPRAHDAIGKDVLFLGRDGVHSLSTVQEYGDVSSNNVTVNLRGLWQHDNQIDQRKVIPNRKSCVVHSASLSKTVISVQRAGHSNIQSMYVLNHDTKQWTGPWEFDDTLVEAGGGGLECIEMVDFGVPSATFLFAASTLGDVAYLGNDRKADYTTSADGDGYPIQFFLRSARLDCRSLNPSFIRKFKTWTYLRLYILARDGSDVRLRWNTDHGASDTETRSLNPYKEPLLDSTFILGQSPLGDPERVSVVHFKLDTRGRWLEFTVEIDGDTDASDKDIFIAGFEVDAIIGGEEQE